jgi:NAD+ diphosphatase
MEKSKIERAMVCPTCGNIEYPKICPAVIVAVVNGDKILVSRYAGRAYKRYALLAGFMEIGEAFESTIRREVMEEVGLKVKNITYYKSQPWAFTDTVLAGFYCQLDGDDKIRLDENELQEAEFITREELPVNENDISLTAEMMEAFRTKRYPMYEEWEGKNK